VEIGRRGYGPWRWRLEINTEYTLLYYLLITPILSEIYLTSSTIYLFLKIHGVYQSADPFYSDYARDEEKNIT